MSPIWYILNIYFLQKFPFLTCHPKTFNLSTLKHLMITGEEESLMQINKDYFQMKSSSRNFDIKTYELKPNEEILYANIPQYIIQPPSILYTSKWQPAIVQCVAEPVILLYIVCVTNPNNPTRRYDDQDYVELSAASASSSLDQINQNVNNHDNALYLKLSQNYTNKQNRKTTIRLIDENTVEEWFGDYWCQCEAWNNILELGEPRVRISNQTHVRIAYLNKRFIKHPESTRIPLGWTVEFTCEPPDGRPIPKVYWMKNGRKLEFNHSQDSMSKSLKQTNHDVPNYQIINHDLNINYSGLISRLIIHHTHLNDEGIYTCVVENQAGRRISSNAQLTIHTDGHWSSWSSWSNCPNDCVIHQSNTSLSQLSNHSKISKYTDKLICSMQCRQLFGQRTRWCNAPEPHGGGRKCYGENIEHLSCYDICLDNLTTNSQQINHHDDYLHNETKQITAIEFGLLFGLGLAIVCFLIAATSVLYIFANKWCPFILKFLPNQTLLSMMRLFHTTSIIHWLKCKQTPNPCHNTIITTGNSSLHDFNSLQQFMEYKSETAVYSLKQNQFNVQLNGEQSLHYDCVSLMPLNRNNSNNEKSITSINQIYTDYTNHSHVKPSSYITNYNLDRTTYQSNDNKYYHNSLNYFHSNLPIQLNSQQKLSTYIMTTDNNTFHLPSYLTNSHSTQFIQNLQLLKEFNHQTTNNSPHLNHSFNQLNMFIHSKDTFPYPAVSQGYFFTPTTTTSTTVLNTKLTTMEDYISPYFSVDISSNVTNNNSSLNSLDSRKRTNLIQSIVPISS
ncbi:unnamed protein product [Schistosoma turkestanicum]|nr:unnamed protein product [Schistosoma turkestanicum]